MKIQYKYAVALTSALGLFMAVLDNTIVNVALTPMANAFHTDLNSVQWVITAYFLAQAAVIPAAGYLANRVGIKKIFMVCLALFTFGSLLCGLSDLVKDGNGNPQIGLLIFFRVVQGIGGGALFPLATAIAFGAFPPNERAASSAIVGIPVLLAPAFGPTVGGLIVDSAGWNWIFYVNVPIGIVTLFLIWRVLKPDVKEVRDPAERRAGFDIVGLLLSMVGVIAIVYAFTIVSQTNPDTINPVTGRGDIYGWGYNLVWILMGIGVALLVAFGFYELRVAKDPVMDLRLFKTYNFTMASIVTWLVRGVIFGSFFLLPVFFENIRYPHLSAVNTGLALMPQGLAAGVAIALGGKLYNIIGPRWLVFMGMIALTISSFMLTQLDNNSDGWSLVPILAIRGIGFGWGAFPVQTLALSAVTGRALPKASSLYNVTAQIFSSIGIAVLTTVFVSQTVLNAPTTAQTQPILVNAALKQPASQAFQQQYLSTHQGITLEQAKTAPDFQSGIIQSVLDKNKAEAYAQQYVSQHPGTNPAQLQGPNAPTDYLPGLLKAAAPDVAAELGGQATAAAGVPALKDVFTIVTWSTATMILVALLLPGPTKKQAMTVTEGEPAEERHAMVMEG